MKDRLQRFVFSKGFVLALSIKAALTAGFASTFLFDSVCISLAAAGFAFALVWALFYLLIFFILTNSTARGEQI